MSDQNIYKNTPLPSASDIEKILAEITERSKADSKELRVATGLGFCKKFVADYGKGLFLFGVDNGSFVMHPGIWDYVNELRNTK